MAFISVEEESQIDPNIVYSYIHAYFHRFVSHHFQRRRTLTWNVKSEFTP